MEPAFHLVLPTILAIALGTPIDTALSLTPLSLLFDLDILLNAHRRLHSLAILMTIIIPTTVVVITQFPYLMVSYLVGVFYFSSHLLLDIFAGEMALFYPLSPKGYGLKFKVQVENTPLGIGDFKFGVKVVPEIKERKGSFTLLSGQGATVILLSSIVIILRLWR